MLLADCDPGPHTNDSGSQSLGREALHPFLYGRVIGIYHANIVYIGQETKGYDANRFDFLHVRWYQMDNTQPGGQSHCGWDSLRLDRLTFLPMATEGSFSFVDPKPCYERLPLDACILFWKSLFRWDWSLKAFK